MHKVAEMNGVVSIGKRTVSVHKGAVMNGVVSIGYISIQSPCKSGQK